MSARLRLAFGHWRVSVEHPWERCHGFSLADTALRSQCKRSGLYGWRDASFCYQHHPDYEGWCEEKHALERIAQAAIDRALLGPRRGR